ncbi:MAG: alpha/beta fold hydrolase [Myxococcales bacterium]|nr:alpha/beta fold hydrolase [Myxococcales bacterium]
MAIHGWGASAHDLLGLAPLLADGQALVLCPQGPVTVPVGPGQMGYGWFPLRPSTPVNPVEFAQGSVALRSFVDQALRVYPADLQRVVLLGFSQGGLMGFDLALRQPQRFRGLAALATWFPEELAAALPRSEETRGLPVLQIHGRQDPLIELTRAHEGRDRLADFGVEMTYREFDMGHELRPAAVDALRSWLAERL